MENSGQSFHPIQELQQWLEQHIQQQLHIEKMEDQDLDLVHIRLERVSLGDQQIHDLDDYIEDQALLLHGAGEVENAGQSSKIAIPQRVYEIPITPHMLVEERGQQLLVSNQRAVYRITVL